MSLFPLIVTPLPTMFNKFTHIIRFSIAFLLMTVSIPLHSADSCFNEEKKEDTPLQISAFSVNQNRPLLPVPRHARRRPNLNCPKYTISALEILTGAGVVTKGVSFSILEDLPAREITFILVPDIFLGIFLMVDGLYRLFSPK